MHPSQDALIAEILGGQTEKSVTETVVVAANDHEWTTQTCRLLAARGFDSRAAKLTSSLARTLTPERRYIVLCRPDFASPDELKACRQVRERTESLPIYQLLLLPKKQLADPGSPHLSLADDFLTTPFSDGELIARLLIAQRNLRRLVEFAQREAQMEGLRQDLEEQNRLLDEAMSYLTGANNRFAELFEGIPAACYCLDDEGRIHEWNRAAAEMYGYQAHEVISRHVWDVFEDKQGKTRDRDMRRAKEMVRRLVAGECLHGVEVEVCCKDGRMLHVLRNTITICTADQKARGVVTADIDITERRELERQVLEQLRTLTDLNTELQNGQKELARANAKLEKLAATDSLTGLRNRRFFQDTVVRQFSFATRHKLPLSLIMIDVDWFKPYNDTFGHPAGDELLKELARLLENGIRNHDCIARYGGEEFVVLLPTTGLAGSKDVAERLRHTVETHAWHLRPVTISVGAATFTPGEEQPGVDHAQELITAADKALYLAKANGRNRIEHFNDMPANARIPKAHGRAKRAA